MEAALAPALLLPCSAAQCCRRSRRRKSSRPTCASTAGRRAGWRRRCKRRAWARRAVIAEFGNHLGGLTPAGSGATDIGNKAAIGGIAREFYHRIALHYANSNAWRFEKRADYFAQQRRALGAQRTERARMPTMWTFEPHVAEDILFQMLNEAKVPVYFQQRLASVQEGRRAHHGNRHGERQGLSRRRCSSMPPTKAT